MSNRLNSLILLVLALYWPRRDSLAQLNEAPISDEGYITVIGTADDSLPNKADAAQSDAYRQALINTAPVFVENRAASSMNQLISNYTYTEVRGFIEDSRLLGGPYSRGGVYHQTFKIKVNTQDLNLEMIKQKIDVKVLYDQVARPKICLAIDDHFKKSPGEAAWELDPVHFSNGIIIQYFQKKHSGFIFKDLKVLGRSSREPTDLLAEASQSSFDILVYGTTRAVPKSVPAGRPRQIRFDTIAQDLNSITGPSYTCETSWNVINVSTRETLFTVLSFSDGEPSTDSDLNNVPPMYRSVEPRAAELFRELLSYWNRAALTQLIDLSFESFETIDPLKIVSRLNTVPGIDPQTVKFQLARGGKSDFQVSATRNFSEILSGLARAFESEFTVYSASANTIKLKAAGGKSAEITLKIAGISLSGLRDVEEKLRTFAGLQDLRRETFTDSVGTYTVKTYNSPEEVGLYLESSFPNRLVVTSATSNSVDLSYGN